jgi:hypothetical protein
VHLVRLFI